MILVICQEVQRLLFGKKKTMTDKVSNIRNWTRWRPEPSDVQWSLHEVHSFLIVDTSKGIISLIPWSLAKEKKQKKKTLRQFACILVWFTIQLYIFNMQLLSSIATLGRI